MNRRRIPKQSYGDNYKQINLHSRPRQEKQKSEKQGKEAL